MIFDMINLITHILKNYFWQYRLSIKSMQRCELNHHNMTFGGKSLNKSEALKSSIYDSCSNSISFLPHISSKRNISAMYYKTKAWQKLLSWVILGTFLKGRYQGTFDKKGVSHGYSCHNQNQWSFGMFFWPERSGLYPFDHSIYPQTV